MTIPEYSARMDQVLRFVGRLLTAPDGSVEWRIGRKFVMIPDSERMTYIEALIDSHLEKSREFEIGWDLRAIMLDLPESRVSA